MKLILKASVIHLGEPGDLVDVKKGYARNYLIPQGLAIQATEANLRAIDHEIEKLKFAAAEQRAVYEALAARIATVDLSFERKVSDPATGGLYGSVSVADIGDALETRGYEVERGEIHLEHPIKQLGEYEIPISLAHGVEAPVRVAVVGEDGELAPTAAAADPGADQAPEAAATDAEVGAEPEAAEPDA